MLISWIFSLQNIQLKLKYNESISNAIMSQNIMGKHLPSIDKNDLFNWGIVHYQDRIDWLKEIDKSMSQYKV